VGSTINVEFAMADALQLERLGRSFKTVLDCGLFHTFDDDDERTRYAASLAQVTSTMELCMCCVSVHPITRKPRVLGAPVVTMVVLILARTPSARKS